jgi:hypothetical protein
VSEQVGYPSVQGYCPMGCGTTLFLGASGHVTCSFVDCPNPCAVDEILDDRETEHIVEFGANTFTVKHPLRERLDDALLRCELHSYCRSLGGPPVVRGRYRATLPDGSRQWLFEPIPEPKEAA